MVSCVCIPSERNRKAEADHPGTMKPCVPSTASLTFSCWPVTQPGAQPGRWWADGGWAGWGEASMSHLKHNPLTVTFRNSPSLLCKFSICTYAFCLLNVINWRCICSVFWFFFCQHDSTNPRPYFKLLHRTSLLTPRTPQGGGSPSVLLTLYKAGGACFSHLDFFLMFFYVWF